MTRPIAVFAWKHDLHGGLDEVRRYRLYEHEQGMESHVQVILNEVATYGLRQPDREVRDLWIAETAQGQPVGMALVTAERLHPRAAPVDLVNLFVAPSARHQGVGRQLLLTAQSSYLRLDGHYTPESERLYAQLGIENVRRHAAGGVLPMEPDPLAWVDRSSRRHRRSGARRPDWR